MAPEIPPELVQAVQALPDGPRLLESMRSDLGADYGVPREDVREWWRLALIVYLGNPISEVAAEILGEG